MDEFNKIIQSFNTKIDPSIIKDFHKFIINFRIAADCCSSNDIDTLYDNIINSPSNILSLDYAIKTSIFEYTITGNQLALIRVTKHGPNKDAENGKYHVSNQTNSRVLLGRVLETLLFLNDEEVLDILEITPIDRLILKNIGGVGVKESYITTVYKFYLNRYPELNITPKNLEEFRNLLKTETIKQILEKLEQNIKEYAINGFLEGFLTNITLSGDFISDLYTMLVRGAGVFYTNGPYEDSQRFKLQYFMCKYLPSDSNIPLPFRNDISNSITDEMKQQLYYSPAALVRLASSDPLLYDDIKNQTNIDPIVNSLDKGLTNLRFQQYAVANNINLLTTELSLETCEISPSYFMTSSAIFECANTEKQTGIPGDIIDNELPMIVARLPTNKDKFNLLYMISDICLHIAVPLLPVIPPKPPQPPPPPPIIPELKFFKGWIILWTVLYFLLVLLTLLRWNFCTNKCKYRCQNLAINNEDSEIIIIDSIKTKNQ